MTRSPQRTAAELRLVNFFISTVALSGRHKHRAHPSDFFHHFIVFDTLVVFFLSVEPELQVDTPISTNNGRITAEAAEP
jgi:hypothetical protein